MRPQAERKRVTELNGIGGGLGGVFSKFEWAPDDYDSYLNKLKEEFQAEKQRRLDAHGEKQFYAGSKPSKRKYKCNFS